MNGHIGNNLEADGLDLANSLLPPDVSLLAQDFSSLGLGNLGLTSTGLSGVSQQNIQSIATSMQNFATVAAASAGPSAVERSGSRNSTCSPAMSDSGISVDAGSNALGAQNVSFAALQRIGNVACLPSGEFIQ